MLISPFGPFFMASASAFAPFVAYGAAVTWNPSDKSADITLSGSNLTVQSSRTDSVGAAARATVGKSSGCWYLEVTISQADNAVTNFNIGIGNASFTIDGSLASSAKTGLIASGSAPIATGAWTASGSGLGTLALSGVIMLAMDLDRGELYFGYNGTWAGSSNPAFRIAPSITGISGTVYPAVSVLGSGGGVTGGDRLTGNFGATAFAYTAP